METFLQMAGRVAAERKQKPFVTGRLDPACIMLKSESLPGLDGVAAMADLEGIIQGRRAVAPGALVHRFARTYESERQDLVELIPWDAYRILDIGCASGGYGKTVKAIKPDVYIAGVEINPELVQKARFHYDLVYTGRVETLEIPEHRFDLINCGDVLEHLYDPWAELNRFYELLRPNGYLVTSIPNMGHWSVLLELLHGSFCYVPSGLQFVSHIRWFTRDSIFRMLGEAGFAVEIMDAVKPELSLEGIEFIDKMIQSRHGDREMLETMAYNIRAKRT
jgi:2-polyprenyl-3-methyl-5-hydroxy-6-metoxy-1,4-benzoquinol methylase